MSITINGYALYFNTESVVLRSPGKMADKKEDMGVVTHQLSAVDDDLRKGGDVQEKTVASVALGMSCTTS